MRLIRMELRKLSSSLALTFVFVVPMALGLLCLAAVASAQDVPSWSQTIGQFALPIWSLFLLPMSVTAFSILVCQIEHRGQGWDYVLTIVSRPSALFATKFLIVIGATVLMSCLLIINAVCGCLLGAAIRGSMLPDVFPVWTIGNRVLAVAVAALALSIIQAWAAIRFRSFVVPMGLGIAGTLVTLALSMTDSEAGAWFPWAMPIRVLTGGEPYVAAAGGLVLGLTLLPVCLWDVTRRSKQGWS